VQGRLLLVAAELGAADMRADGGRRALAHLARVEDAAEGMLAMLEQLLGDLSQLLEGLRDGGERLAQGLAGLREQVGEIDAGPPEEPAPEPEDLAAAEPEPEPEPAPEPVQPAAGDADEAGARIIALNMALGGSLREETAGYLAENFSLSDPGALLDDVYAKVGK
jgi:hypothetical protein